MISSFVVYAGLSLAPLGLALVLILGALRRRQKLKAYDQQGIQVTGTIKAIEFARDTDGSTSYGDVQYRMADGTVTTQRVELAKPASGELPRKGDTVVVTYLPDVPDSARIPVQQHEYHSVTAGFGFGVVLIIFFVVFIAILLRDLP
jgi:Protein of unknown function (DUF3592)